MPELRQNIATREWVIIARERARRPNAFAESPRHRNTINQPAFDDRCPFCPGNEELDLEICRFPQEGDWHIRVVNNKYPALSQSDALVRSFEGTKRSMTGVGHHEVLVEHPRHNTTLALLHADEVERVLAAYLHRGQAIGNDPRIEQIVYFKNHGDRAGASMAHPHSQLIGLPIVPGDIRHRIEEARRYFDDTGHCVFCAMLADELKHGERLIAFNAHFVAFALYASSSPFHIWIMPRVHRASFLHVEPSELASLAKILRDVLHRLYHGLNDPDYNLVIRSTPVKEPENAYFHWYLTLIPRLSHTAGLELGSGVWINPSVPEDCAAFLRNLDPDR
jgi:UDPglucose--hexose-1-phosphate uridylyltransferase